MTDSDAVLKKEKVAVGIIFTGIILTVIYILIISSVSVKLNNEDFGRVDRLGSYKASGQSTGIVLNSVDEELLQKFSFNKSYKNYEFCFEGQINTSNYLSVVVISQTDDLSEPIYLNNDTSKYCVDINKNDLFDNMFLGLRCTNCNTTDFLDVYKEVLGAEVYQINEVEGVITQSKLRSSAYFLRGIKTTGELLRIYNDAWILMMLATLIGLIFSISMTAFTNLVDGDKP